MHKLKITAAMLLIPGTLVLAQFGLPAAGPMGDDAVAEVLGKPITQNDITPMGSEIKDAMEKYGRNAIPVWIEQYRNNRLITKILEPIAEAFFKQVKAGPTEEEVQGLLDIDIKRRQVETAKLHAEAALIQVELDRGKLTSFGKQRKIDQRDLLLIKAKKVQSTPGITRDFAEAFVKNWKFNGTLYKKFGGRIARGGAGPEPIDAYRRLLEQHRDNGTIRIFDQNYYNRFWNYYTNDTLHVFLPDEASEIWDASWEELIEMTQKREKKLGR